MLALEREGLDPVLKRYDLTWQALDIAPCRLFYRRRVIDMPLSDIPADAPPKRADSLRQARVKILEKAQRKYLFDFADQHLPTGLLIEQDRLVGLEISRTQVVEGKARLLPDTAAPVRGPFVISSIGSIPEPIAGIPHRGEVYEYLDMQTGLLLDGATPVFAAGNVLTGKGNIKDSLDNATEVGTLVAERYLGVADDGTSFSLGENVRQEVRATGEALAGAVSNRPRLAAEKVAEILERVRERQRQVGYEGNYRAWLARVTPPDLE